MILIIWASLLLIISIILLFASISTDSSVFFWVSAALVTSCIVLTFFAWLIYSNKQDQRCHDRGGEMVRNTCVDKHAVIPL